MNHFSEGFLCLVARNWENFKFLGGLLFRRGEARPFSSIKPSVTSHVNSRILSDKNKYFLTFTWNFSVREFSVCLRVHSNPQKSVY